MASCVLKLVLPKTAGMGSAQPSHFLDEFNIHYINETENSDAAEGWTWTGTVSTKHFTQEFFESVKRSEIYKGWSISCHVEIA
jgi:hypothetical protein